MKTNAGWRSIKLLCAPGNPVTGIWYDYIWSWHHLSPPPHVTRIIINWLQPYTEVTGHENKIQECVLLKVNPFRSSANGHQIFFGSQEQYTYNTFILNFAIVNRAYWQSISVSLIFIN